MFCTSYWWCCRQNKGFWKKKLVCCFMYLLNRLCVCKCWRLIKSKNDWYNFVTHSFMFRVFVNYNNCYILILCSHNVINLITYHVNTMSILKLQKTYMKRKHIFFKLFVCCVWGHVYEIKTCSPNTPQLKKQSLPFLCVFIQLKWC